MDKIKGFDTIVGISTAIGGGVNIIRMSGQDSINILSKIFKTKIDVFDIKSHTINYGFIFDEDKRIDEVLVSVMKAPRTYTMEDIVEINCHGGVGKVWLLGYFRYWFRFLLQGCLIKSYRIACILCCVLLQLLYRLYVCLCVFSYVLCNRIFLMIYCWVPRDC